MRITMKRILFIGSLVVFAFLLAPHHVLAQESLTVVTSANTAYTQVLYWRAEKTVDAANLTLHAGDSATAHFDTAVYGRDNTPPLYGAINVRVYGTVSITNNQPSNWVRLESVWADVDSFGADIRCPVRRIGPQGTLFCSFDLNLGSPVGFPEEITVTVTTTSFAEVFDITPLTWGEPSAIEGPSTITFVDSEHGTVSISAPETYGYVFGSDVTLTCPADESVYVSGHYTFTYISRVTLLHMGMAAVATVAVDCTLDPVPPTTPLVTLTTNPGYTVQYQWWIGETASPPSAAVLPGEEVTIQYNVELDATPVENGFGSSGVLSVYNQSPDHSIQIQYVDVSSSDPDTYLSLTCDAPNFPPPVEVPPLAVWACSLNVVNYDRDGRSHTDTFVNSARLGIDNHEYWVEVPVAFSTAAVHEVDSCVSVTESTVGSLGTVCFGNLPWWYSYSHTYAYEACGDYEESNAATFTVGAQSGTAGAGATINVICP